MKVLGIESSCDECAAAVVEDGERILSNVVATQIPFHAAYSGVVPEIASRKHTEWIGAVVQEALDRAGLTAADIEGVAATSRPGLLGSLIVGLTFAKTFAWARGLPFVACDHLLAHLYASRLVETPRGCAEAAPPGELPAYPFLGLLVSGGHSVICRVDGFDAVTVLGTTVDDAVGEAFDKVSKHFGFGYPGGKYIDELAKAGDENAFRFPLPNLYKERGGTSPRYDLSYSGLKTAVINQREQFRAKGAPPEADAAAGGAGLPPEEAANIAASFQKAAVEILLRALFRAVEDTGLRTVVTGGGVAANSHLRARLAGKAGLRVWSPPPALCGDNGAMVAGLGWQYLSRGMTSPLTENASARVPLFRRRAA